MTTSSTHPRTIGLILGAVLLAWGAGTPLAWGQGKTSVRLDSMGNPELRRAAEKSASAAITAINRAVALNEERPDLSDAPVTDRGREAILSRWDQASFYCNRTDLTRSLSRRAGGTYEIRDIPLLEGDDKEQRRGILLVNEEGTVIGFRYGSEPATGTIIIASEPSGATVVGTFGDTTATRTAPAQFSEVPAGPRRFTIQKEAYETVDTTLAVAAGRRQTVTIPLRRERVPLRVQTDPAGATVFVNGDSIGTAPLTERLVPGEYTVRIERQGYLSVERTVTVDEGRDPEIRATLRRPLIARPADRHSGPVANVRVARDDRQLVVRYNLTGEKDGYEVALLLSTDGGATFQELQGTVEGAVGEEVAPGSGKQITWAALTDYPDGLSGDRYRLRVNAQAVDGGNTILWVIGSALAAGAGGTVALLLGGSGGGDGGGNGENGGNGFPTPPGPP